MPPFLVILIVTAIAFLYSSVGFGGATGYLAAMSLFDIPIQTMASTALVLNILVASTAFRNYQQAGHLDRQLLWPFLVTSIPAAFLGGYLKLSDQIYHFLLYTVLAFVAARLLFFNPPDPNQTQTSHRPSFLVTSLVGWCIGMLSGMVGIGGGIFLSPVIILARWGTSKQAATVAAAFIVLNSVSGLTGRLLGDNFTFGAFGLALLPFGLLAALAGSQLGSRHLSSNLLRRTLGIVILIAVANFWSQVFS